MKQALSTDPACERHRQAAPPLGHMAWPSAFLQRRTSHTAIHAAQAGDRHSMRGVPRLAAGGASTTWRRCGPDSDRQGALQRYEPERRRPTVNAEGPGVARWHDAHQTQPRQRNASTRSLLVNGATRAEGADLRKIKLQPPFLMGSIRRCFSSRKPKEGLLSQRRSPPYGMRG